MFLIRKMYKSKNMKTQFIFHLVVASGTVLMLFFLAEYLYESEKQVEKIIVRQDAFLYPQPWTLVNLSIKYVINNPVCHTLEKVTVLILITSHAGDIELRRKIRQVLPAEQLHRLNMIRLFLTAKIDENRISTSSKYHSISLEKLFEENSAHHDLVMGDFFESYRNLTYKHLMGLQWATRFCAHAEFIIKQDDDIIVDMYQMKTVLINTNLGNELTNSNIIAGKLLTNMKVIRDRKSKWFVPVNEYTEENYPPFVSGWAYITTVKVVRKILNAAKTEKYFWIDDMHIAGTLAKIAKITLKDLSAFFTPFKGQLYCCIATSSAKSRDNKPYWCDFLIGPSNDDLSLMEMFHQHALFCYTSNICTRRSQNESLTRTCVVTNQMIINKSLPQYSKYDSQTKKVKQVLGQWKMVKHFNSIRNEMKL